MSESENLLGSITEFAVEKSNWIEKFGVTAFKFYLQSAARDLLPNERVNFCWRYLLPNRESVELIYSQERKRARTKGTMKCGSAWVCTVCASYVSEQRRRELILALENSRDSLFPAMITYTARHDAYTDLKSQISRMAEAYRWMKSTTAWKTAKSEWFIEGSIRAMEITYGKAGWHPHYHEIILSDVKLLSSLLSGDIEYYAASLENQLRPIWRGALERFGLSADLAVGLTVRASNREIAEYVAKWGKMPTTAAKDGITDEITSNTAKIARRGNFSVLDLLFASAQGDKRAGKLFIEFAMATKGRSQLQWSRGLKQRLSIEEIRDEIASEGIETETDILLATISRDEWTHLTRTGHLAQLMTYANQGDSEKVSWLLGELRSYMPKVENVDFSGF